MQVHTLGVTGLVAAYAEGRLDPPAALEAYLGRIDRFDGALNSFTALDVERARRDAADSAERLKAAAPRALEGVPIAVKANIDVAGLATTAGVAARREARANRDAAVVARLRAAGVIVLGHVNMHEAALGATTDNPHFGATHNPHREGYTPGGSSGGSGAAVAAGLCAAALGTDTLGSVRIPAAYCGVYGLKPGNGLVDDAGLVPLSRRLDAIGPLARSVADTGAMLAAMADLTPAEPVRKVATLDIVDAVEVQPEVRRAYRTAVELLQGLGLDVQAYATGTLDLAKTRMAGFVEAGREARSYFGEAMAMNPAGFSTGFAGLLDFAGGFDSPALAAGEVRLDTAAKLLRGILADAGAIVLPTTPQAAFPHASEMRVGQADFTALANIAGLPALSLPAGWTEDGLPVGVQLIGRAGGERTLLELAGRLDAVLKGYRPPPGYV